MLSLLLSTSCLLDISTNIVRISLLGFSFVAYFREQHCLFPHCLMTNIPTWRLKKYWNPIREIHQKSGVPIREIREKSESRPSAKLNPREIFEFRGRRHPRNLIPAKFNTIKVLQMKMSSNIVVALL